MADVIVNHSIQHLHISVQTYDTLLELALKMQALSHVGQSAQFLDSQPSIKISYLQVMEDTAEVMVTVMDNIEFDNQSAA